MRFEVWLPLHPQVELDNGQYPNTQGDIRHDNNIDMSEGKAVRVFAILSRCLRDELDDLNEYAGNEVNEESDIFGLTSQHMR